MKEADWSLDPSPVREFVALATAEGWRPTSIDQGRSVLVRYNDFLQGRFESSLETARWQEFAAYKAFLGQQAVARTTTRGYLSYILSYYRLKAQAAQDPDFLETYTKMKAIGMPRKAKSTKWKPFSPETLTRILDAAKSYAALRERSPRIRSEDYVFVMTLLYTGGRAQFYGLRVREIDFDQTEVSTTVKGGKTITIPLHPTLAQILKDHLATRTYQSEFLFRKGRDLLARTGQKANRQNAWRACKRVQKAAGLTESVHPHRFRKTLATLGKRLGMDPQFLQAILAHESVTMTLDRYAEVELEDVKREFAKLDLSNGQRTSTEPTREELLEHLRKRSPPGKEQAWNLILEGLQALLGDETT